VTIRVVLADDQTLVRSGLAMILATQADIEVVGEAADGAQAVTLTRRLRPDVVLMDIRMPGTDGLSATRAIAADASITTTRIIVLTTYDLDEYLFEALRAGAAGFLLKGASPEDLIRGVRETAAGESLLAPSATRRLINEFVSSAPAVLRGPDRGDALRRVETLTPRERQVLSLMATGFSNAEIADRLFLGDNTVKTHVSHVLDKLAARDRVQAVIVAYDAGVTTPAGQVDSWN
jgi:DNA-binding NarL/FixJ family response regulator